MPETYYMTSVQNALQNRDRAELMRQEKIDFEEQQREKKEQRAIAPKVLELFAEMQLKPPPSDQAAPPAAAAPPPPPVQPPAPGQSSVPMAAAPPPQMQQLGPPPGAAPSPTPQGAGPGAPMPAPAPIPPWKSMPGPPGGPQMGAPGPGQLSAPPSTEAPQEGSYTGGKGFLPPNMGSPEKFIQAMKKANVPPEQRHSMLKMVMPLIDKNNKQLLDEAGLELRIANAMVKAQDEELKRWRAERTAGQTDTKIAQKGEEIKQRQPLVDARVKKLGGQGGEPGKPVAWAPTKGTTEDSALTIQAWQYIEKGTLPYRKGTGGGKDANTKVMNRVGEIAKDMNMAPEEIVAQPADWKANASSLAFQTKKLDAIEGQLNSFHNNLDTWDNLAKGIPPAIGGERVKEFAKDLKKIDFIGIRSFDEVKLKIQQQFNDPSVAAMMVAAMAAAMDYGRIMQGPQSIASLTEGARNDAERLVNAAADDKARLGIRAALESDTQGQVKGIKDQLSTIRGRMGIKGGKGAAEKASAGKVEGAPAPYSDAEKEARYQKWKAEHAGQ
jgi:hypothetical protein